MRKLLYCHSERSEKSIQNTEYGKQNTDYNHTDKLTLHSHTERSEVSKGKSVNLLNHLDSLDSSATLSPQNDKVRKGQTAQ